MKPKKRTVARQLADMVDEKDITVRPQKHEPATALSFNMDPTKKDSAIMFKIADRAIKGYNRAIKGYKTAGVSIEFDEMDIHMYLCAVHLNGCPLRLAALLDADNFNFWHDIGGILAHLDRNTGELKSHFIPFSKRRG